MDIENLPQHSAVLAAKHVSSLRPHSVSKMTLWNGKSALLFSIVNKLIGFKGSVSLAVV